MLPKTLEFLDAMCKVCFLNKNWRLVRVTGYGDFVCHENEPDNVYKVFNLDLWMEENQLKQESETVDCQVRHILSNKAKILPLIGQPIELWLNVIVPELVDGDIRVEPYLDQNSALMDAEEELKTNFEVHTRRVVVKVP